MHFVYKMDNLFRSIRVSDKNSSVTKGFHFLNLFEHQTFCVFQCTIQSHIINFQPFLTSFVIFHAFTDFLGYKTLKWKSTANELWKGWNFAWYNHFTHLECAKKLRGLRPNMDALRVQNEQSLSKYQAFIRKLVCYKGISIFWNYLNSRLLCVQNAPFKATSSILKPFWLHLLFFMHLLIFWAIWPWKWKALQMNSQKVESWQGIIISPT